MHRPGWNDHVADLYEATRKPGYYGYHMESPGMVRFLKFITRQDYVLHMQSVLLKEMKIC